MSTDMNLEANRRETFNKLLDNNIYEGINYSVIKGLSRNGFYLVGPIQVACIHCNVVFTVQNVLEHTVHMHEKFSPDCEKINVARLDENFSKTFVIKDEIGNKNKTESADKKENKLNEKIKEKETNLYEQATSSKYNTESVKDYTQSNKKKDELGESIAEKPLIHHNDPKFPKYKTVQARLKSFKEWPKFMKQKPEELSNAGFFYTNKSDIVTCYSCGCGIRNWEVDDDPWGEHIRWYSICEHIKLNKTKEETEDILDKRRNYHPSDYEDEQSSPTQGTDVAMDLLLKKQIALTKYAQFILEEAYNKTCEGNANMHECMNCKSSESDSVVFPCKHAVACYNCSRSAKNCFHCNEEIQKVEKLYFA